MRITNHMLSSRVLHNLTEDLANLQRVQEQMSTGLAVSKPSDDPVATGRILTLQSSLQAQDRYLGNINDANDFLTITDQALNSIDTSLIRVKELMLQGGNGTLTPGDRAAVGQEVDEIIDQLVETGNTMCGSQYVFGGYATTKPPLTRDGDTINYNGDNGQINYEVAQGVTMQVNIEGNKLFQETGLFSTLIEIKNDLKNDSNIGDLNGKLLDKLNQISDQVNSFRSVVGARENRLEMASSRNKENKAEMTKILSGLQDVDIAQATMEYSERAYVYQAALATAAKVLQPSLVDFLAR